MGDSTSAVRIQGNRIELASAASGRHPWVLNAGQADVTVSADFTGGALRVADLVLRASPGGNYIGIGADGSDLIITKTQNGDRSVLTRVTFGFEPGHTYRLEARATGTIIEAYVDGVLRLVAIDEFQQSATRHGVAFSTDDPQAMFDNFAVLSSGWPPTISGPPNQTNLIGSTIAPVQITATDFEGATLIFGASGLPAGLIVNPTTGQITGTLTAPVGVYSVIVTAFDGTFTSTRSLKWSIIMPPPSAPPLSKVFDTFTSSGGSGPLTAHVPDMRPAGSSWSAVHGLSPLLDGGGAVSTATSGFVVATIDATTSNGVVATEFTSSASDQRAGLVLRLAGPEDFLILRYRGHWGFGRLELIRRLNGLSTTITGVSVGPIDGTTQRIEARLAGSSVTALWNGVSVFERTVPDNQTSTHHGLYWEAVTDATVTYDNFKVTTESFTPTLAPGTRCEAQLSSAVITISADSGTRSTDVTLPAGCTWTTRMLGGNASLVDPGAFIGGGVQTVQFSIPTNQVNEPRVAYASIAGQLVTIFQAATGGDSCEYVLSEDHPEFGPPGGTLSITVTPSHPACTWTSSTATEWIELRSGGVHAGAGSFLIGAHPNGITGRTAAARVGTEEIWVNQIGDGCTFTVEPRAFPINSSDGGMSAFGGWIHASITIPPGCGWEAWTMTPSIVDQVQLPSSNPAGSGQIQIHLLENTTPLRRTATVHVGKPGYPSQNITITQCEAGGCAPPQPATSFAFPPANGLDPGGTRLFVHTDALGSVRMLTDDAQTAVARYDYQPFGQDWQTTGAQAAANKVRFAGGERETDVVFGGWQALDYFGARYYQSQTGRFTRVDPGHVGATPLDPQSWNGYVYARNNPLVFNDPLGLEACKITLHGEDAQAAGVNDGDTVDGDCVVAPKRNVGLNPVGFLNAGYESLFPDPVRRAQISGFFEGAGGTIAAMFSSSGPPSCLGLFVGETLRNLSPITTDLGPDDVAEAVTAAAAFYQFNRAQQYAASRPNYLGGQGLAYPNKSSVYRGMMKNAARTAKWGLVAQEALAMGAALWEEAGAAQAGRCR